MDGVSRAVGSGVTVVIDGKDYILSPFTYRDHGMVEQEILKRRMTPLKIAKAHMEGLDPVLQEKLLAKALDDTAKLPNYTTEDEINEFTVSDFGIVFSVWLSLRKRHPEVTLDQLQDALYKMNVDEIEQLGQCLAQASGDDELGNETGRTESPAKTTTENPPSEPPGESSSGESAKPITSPQTTSAT